MTLLLIAPTYDTTFENIKEVLDKVKSTKNYQGNIYEPVGQKLWFLCMTLLVIEPNLYTKFPTVVLMRSAQSKQNH